MTTVFDPSLYGRKPKVDKPDYPPKLEVLPDGDGTELEPEVEVPETVEVPEVVGTTFDRRLYDKILGQPEGMNHREYRNVLARYVSTLTEGERGVVLNRRDEIESAESEWRELNHSVLRRLGFGEGEAAMLCDKRLDSPGMRMLIRRRADAIKKGMRAKATLRRVG